MAQVLVEGPVAALRVGESAQLAASALDRFGGTLEGHTFVWQSTDAAVAGVTAAGLVTGIAAGAVEIRAATAGVAGSLLLTVNAVPPPAAVRLLLTSPATAILIGETVQLAAAAQAADGSAVPDAVFDWISGDTDVASVTSTGLVTGVAEGRAIIRVATGELAESLAITVSAVPSTGSLTLALQEIASGLRFPLYLTSPPGDDRLFIVEKGGAIRIWAAGAMRETPFLDLGGRISSDGERGLLGLAFPSDYAAAGRFAVHYTDPAGDTRVSLFAVSGDPDRADPASETVVLAVEQPFPNHNGGQITFGADGYLYIGLGDGGSGGDPQGRGQSLDDLLGSILRIDAGVVPYAIPPDNPLLGSAARPEIWSYGLRNPWRFSFDRGTGDLYVADVGQNQWEEVNYSPSTERGRGANYGWSVMEGLHCFQDSGCDQTGLALPALEYDHGKGCSVTGGYVYRGQTIPELQGHYFYADFCRGWIGSFRMEGGLAVDRAEWPSLAPGGTVSSFGEDAAGELYLMTGGGKVFRIVRE